jgi:hypothetical protein
MKDLPEDEAFHTYYVPPRQNTDAAGLFLSPEYYF